MTRTEAPRPPQANRTCALRVAFAAGGTGGHLMPALATAEALQRLLPCEFLVVGSPRASDRDLRSLLPFPAVEIRVAPFAGGGLLRQVLAGARLPGAVFAAASHLRRFAPDLVIATGGYVCGPSGVAARLLGLPLLILEQNAVPGMTTRLLAPLAQAIGVAYPASAARLGRKATVTGNPIRAALPAAPRRDGVTAPPPPADQGIHVLILGGSQGSRGLNTLLQLALPQLANADVGLTFTHQTGTRDVETIRAAYASNGLPATVTPFIHNIGEAYAQADLVCSRAGATTVSELTYCGLPSILVPFPAAAGLHQHANARELQAAGAAVMLEQEGNGTRLAQTILRLAQDGHALARMAAAAASCGTDDAAGVVARLALSLVDSAAVTRTAGVGIHVATRSPETR